MRISVERKRPSIYKALLVRSSSNGRASPSFLPVILLCLAAGILLGGSLFLVRQIAASATDGPTHFLQQNGMPTSEDASFSSSSADEDPLQLAWLMSFPNSGTSYTSELVRTTTRQKTASNYRTEDAAATVAVFRDSPSGPFWTGFEHEDTAPKLPTGGYLLTKTLCGGYCFRCPPDKYLETPRSFVKKCLEGDRVTDDNGETHVDSYSKDLVARAVHVVRDPFDNVVSRFHLARKNFEKFAVYPSTREGFRDFCASIDKRFHEQELAHGDIFDEAAFAIPCHADFFRYMQWHNLAFFTTWDLNIPSLVLHYEDYTNNSQETQDSLLEFLEQDAVSEPSPFQKGKTYRHYFTDSEIAAVEDMFSKLAFRETLENSQHYFK